MTRDARLGEPDLGFRAGERELLGAVLERDQQVAARNPSALEHMDARDHALAQRADLVGVGRRLDPAGRLDDARRVAGLRRRAHRRDGDRRRHGDLGRGGERVPSGDEQQRCAAAEDGAGHEVARDEARGWMAMGGRRRGSRRGRSPAGHALGSVGGSMVHVDPAAGLDKSRRLAWNARRVLRSAAGQRSRGRSTVVARQATRRRARWARGTASHGRRPAAPRAAVRR